MRKLINTTNAIESMNSTLSKVVRVPGHFPNDEAATELLYLATRNVEREWTRPTHYWGPALDESTIRFEGRLSA